jgi:hypothetical protein
LFEEVLGNVRELLKGWGISWGVWEGTDEEDKR